MRTALTAASESRGQESPGDLNRLVHVEINVYPVARRLAAQQTDVLPIGPVVRYLLLGYPQRLPAQTSGILLTGGDRDHRDATAYEGSGSATAFLRAHAAAPSGSKSPRATSMAAAISASGARPSQ